MTDLNFLVQLAVAIIGIFLSVIVPYAVSIEFRKRVKSKLDFNLFGHGRPALTNGTRFQRALLADQSYHKKWTVQFESGRFAIGNSTFRVCPQLDGNTITNIGPFTQNGPHLSYKVFRKRGLIQIDLNFVADSTTAEFDITFKEADYPRIYCEDISHQARIVPHYIWQKTKKYHAIIMGMHFRLMLLLLLFLSATIVLIGRIASYALL